MNQTNNFEIVEQAKKIYNAKTAFGNKKLIKLLNQISTPDSDGYFEIEGECITEVVDVKWRCAVCGELHFLGVDFCHSSLNDQIEQTCKKCKSKHKINIYE